MFGFVNSPNFSGTSGITIRATLNPTTTPQNVTNGVLAGTNLLFGNAYTATITMGGSGFLEIQRNSFGTATTIASTGSAFTPGFNGLSSYVLEMVVALHAVVMDKEDLGLVPYALFHTILFVLIINVSKILSTIEELMGFKMTWGKLDRVGKL